MQFSKVLRATPAVLLFFALVLSGCGKSSNNTTPTRFDEIPPEVSTDSLQESRQVALGAQVWCDSTDCSPSVAFLTAVKDSGVGQCTSFMVSPDTAITNSHCIPSELKTPGASCAQRIWLHFPSIPGHPREKVECQQVVYASSDSDMEAGKDYAVIKLSRGLARPSIALSKDGFPDDTKFKLYKFDPSCNDRACGAMKSETCVVKLRSAVAQSVDDPGRQMITLADCSIKGGNSGSPLLDDSGQAHGIIFADLSILAKLKINILALTDRNMPKNWVGDFAFATNFACSPQAWPQAWIDTQITPSPSCELPKTSDQKSTYKALEKKILATVEKEMAYRDSSIKWTVGSLSENVNGQKIDYVVPVPKCIRDNTKTPSTLLLPMWKLNAALNKYLQADIDLEFADLRPYEIENGKTLKIYRKSSGWYEKPFVYFNGALPQCTAQEAK